MKYIILGILMLGGLFYVYAVLLSKIQDLATMIKNMAGLVDKADEQLKWKIEDHENNFEHREKRISMSEY